MRCQAGYDAPAPTSRILEERYYFKTEDVVNAKGIGLLIYYDQRCEDENILVFSH